LSIYKIYFCEDTLSTPLNSQKDILFWDQTHTELKLLSAKLDMEINKAGKLVFTMPYTHPYVNKVHKRKTRFYVSRDGAALWSGRVLDTEKSFYKAIQVTVEGALTYLLDTIQRPYDYDDVLNLAIKDGLIQTHYQEQPPSELENGFLLYFLLKRHNSEADADKKFIFNIHNDVIYGDDDYDLNLTTSLIKHKYKSEDYSTTKDEINENIIQRSGGFLIVNYSTSDHRNRLKYCISEEGIKRANQKIRFGENLKDFTESITSENIYTRCIPLGATYDDVENLRRKAYNEEKQEWNKAIDDYNKNISKQKKNDKKKAEKKKKLEEDACGYTKYKEDLANYKEAKYKFDIGQISKKPKKPNTVSPPKTASGRTKTLKDYGYDSNNSKYNRIPAEDKTDSWDDTEYAMPNDVDGKTKITINTEINFWYKSKWKVKINKNVNDYVVYKNSNDDIKKFGIITSAEDVNVSLPKELPNTQSKCNSVFNDYIKELKKQGEKWLKKNRLMSTSISVSAVDLAELDKTLDHIDCGYSIPVISSPHGLGDDGISLLCSACSLNLLSPGESEYTIGAVFKALTDKSVANKERSGKAYGLAKSSYSM